MVLKKTFFPHLRRSAHHLDTLTYEVKGADIRRNILRGTSDERRHGLGLLDKAIRLLENHDAKLFGRISIKGIAQPFDGAKVYSANMQALCTNFQKLLVAQGANGLVIADSRDKGRNANVSHSIFTQKYRSAGDAYPSLLEVPTFGHSDNHAGLQVADWICSGILFPAATYTYCRGHVNNVHVNRRGNVIRERFGARLRALEHRYWDGSRPRGGFTVSDAIRHRGGSALFPVAPGSGRINPVA